jgi:HAD superfamily hydrolase (TIGR01509 family)
MKTEKNIVIFVDFGGVYFNNTNPVITKKFSKKFGTTEKKILDALLGPNYAAHATGKSTEKRYWKHVAAKLKITEKQSHELRNEWYLHAKPQDGMPKLVRSLKKKYKVAALSSITPGWIEYFEKKYKISRRFYDHHYSFIHGVDKPSAKFFLSAAKKMNAKPKDCIVIDDNRKFISAVKKAGGITILFKDAKDAEVKLRKMGVEI